MSALIGKVLATAILRKIVKTIIITTLTELAKKSDNTIDDAIVISIKEAL